MTASSIKLYLPKLISYGPVSDNGQDIVNLFAYFFINSYSDLHRTPPTVLSIQV